MARPALKPEGPELSPLALRVQDAIERGEAWAAEADALCTEAFEGARGSGSSPELVRQCTTRARSGGSLLAELRLLRQHMIGQRLWETT